MDVKYIGGDVPWTLPFGDHFYSASQSSFNDTNTNSLISPDDLDSIARRHGFEPLYATNRKQFHTKQSIFTDDYNTDSQWMNAGVLFTDKIIQPDITGVHQTDYHDDHGHTFCYLCSINQHDHEHTKPRDQSKRRKLIPYNNPKALKARSASLDRISQRPSSSHFISYQFIVRTGSIKFKDKKKTCGTRAQVFLYMYGTENNWTSINLQARKNPSVDGFPSGSVRTFCLKGPEIGELKHLNVNLVGARSDKEWFLNEIEITNLNTSKTWLCEFNCWLPKQDHDDHSSIKPLPGRPTELTFENLSVYILQIRTGEKAFAGTDSLIQVTIHGSKSKTRRLALTSDHADLFEQNQIDTFAIVGWDIGDLLEITVESDKSQLASDWDLKEMIMWKLIPLDDHEHFQVYFPVNKWIGDKISTVKVKRDKYQSEEYHPRGPTCYHIAIKTGSEHGAGTDANVSIIIYGKSGRTAIHHLDNPNKNDFERNTISEFTIMDIDVGQIEQIKIWHDDSGVGSAWLLDSVIIRKKHSTCRAITNVFTQRIDQISKALYRQARDQMKKSHEIRVSSASKEGDNRSGILRSQLDKGSFSKTVTFDKQHKGSHDELKRMQQREKSPSFVEAGHYDHQAFWISTHKYSNNKWLIKSIEEKNSFDLDESTRILFLSDRPNKKIHTTISDKDDDVYEFEAKRWLDKTKNDKKLEVYLKPKSSQLSKHTLNETKFKTTTPDTKRSSPSVHDRHDSKHTSPSVYDRHDPKHLSELERKSLRDSLRVQLNELRPSGHTEPTGDDIFGKKNYRSSSPIQHTEPTYPKSPTVSEKELLTRIPRQPPFHPLSTASSVINPRTSSYQHTTSPRRNDEQFNLTKKIDEIPPRPKTAARSVPLVSPHKTTGYSGLKSAYDLPKDNY